MHPADAVPPLLPHHERLHRETVLTSGRHAAAVKRADAAERHAERMYRDALAAARARLWDGSLEHYQLTWVAAAWDLLCMARDCRAALNETRRLAAE